MSNNDNHVQQFLQLAEQAIHDQLLVKIILSKYRGEEADLQRLTLRPLMLRQQPVLSVVFRYTTRDITKNLSIAEALSALEQWLANDFRNAHLFTSLEEVQLETGKKGKTTLLSHALQQQQNTGSEHNRQKKRFVDSTRPFLTALGITDRQQQLLPSMSHKWKQINKFVEIFSQALSNSPLPADQPVQVVDFGCGKGYLTFAIHDYLHHTLHNNAQVTGVELRQELVDFCNNTAARLEHKGLGFVCGDVKTHAPEHTDVMIALHACDTATDYAIHYGIRANAAIIMCSPCCHKQIRPQMHSPAALKPLLQYGVHLGQEAEMLTDSLRALLLEAHGYSTKVFEFISLEHTNKNKMILAIKQQQATDKQAILEQISALKAFYGIREHCLETLLQPLPATAG